MRATRTRRAVSLPLVGASTALAALACEPASAAPGASKPAQLVLHAKAPLHVGKRAISVPGAKVVLKGSLPAYVPGEKVLVKATSHGRRAKQKTKTIAGTPGKTAKFALSMKPRKRGRYILRATRLGVNGQPTGRSARVRLTVVRAHAGAGASGVGVRALQHRLKKLGYIVNASGRYGGTTERAVLAFRKVNRMARTTVANRAVFRKLAKGGGAFKLRYPRAGKHVEFDWSRQIVVLARGSKPVMTIGTSSGSPATPTAFGKFRFWLKQAGYNQKQMYYSVYFHGGQAIHGFASVPNQPASHGCLRIPIPNAIRVYSWLSLGDTIYSYR